MYAIRSYYEIGASVDWSRERFTLDEGLSDAVREVFVTLYERGLVYRGNYLVNWCPSCGTALADGFLDRYEIDEKQKRDADQARWGIGPRIPNSTVETPMSHAASDLMSYNFV